MPSNYHFLALEEERDELIEKIDSLNTYNDSLIDELDVTKLQLDKATVENENLRYRVQVLEQLLGITFTTRKEDMEMKLYG